MTDRFQNWTDYIDPRIDELTSKGFYLEAFYLFSATIEHSLQKAIEYQEGWVEHMLHKSKLRFQKTKLESLQEMPLGKLISLFARYCEDQTLVSELNSFNSVRKKLVHRLMDNPIIELNKEAKNKEVAYYRLVSKLSRYNMKILKKMIVSEKRKVKNKSA